MTSSPWWYRQRAFTIGVVYFAGFFFGPSLSLVVRVPAEPVAFVLGRFIGPHGYREYLILVVALTLACWALRTWGGAYLRPSTVWSPDALDDRLIAAGPFRFVRNPLYLGNILLALAMALYATPLGAVMIVAGNLIVVYALISVEESLMRHRYGDAFAAYTAAVPALVPHMTPWTDAPPSPSDPSLRLGLRSEIFTALFVAGTILFAIHFW